jgi:hypothetical protein
MRNEFDISHVAFAGHVSLRYPEVAVDKKSEA